MIDNYEALERVTGYNKTLDLASLFEDLNGNDIQFRVINIFNGCRERNHGYFQTLRFLFVK